MLPHTPPSRHAICIPPTLTEICSCRTPFFDKPEPTSAQAARARRIQNTMPYVKYVRQNATTKEGHFVPFYYHFVLRSVLVEIDSVTAYPASGVLSAGKVAHDRGCSPRPPVTCCAFHQQHGSSMKCCRHDGIAPAPKAVRVRCRPKPFSTSQHRRKSNRRCRMEDFLQIRAGTWAMVVYNAKRETYTQSDFVGQTRGSL